ncbi:MAG: MlaD family protein [Microcoleaceae cyanobacterium]
MRSRAVREGSVGLLALAALGLFGVAALWLKGVNFGSQSYQFSIEFTDATGLQMGTPVRYRGVNVGRVVGIQPQTNNVKVFVEVSPPNLVIPRTVGIQINQTGLLSEGFIDLMPPETPLAAAELAADPLSSSCPQAIICDNAELQGQVGISLTRLLNSMQEFSDLYTDPKLFANINMAAQNTAMAAQEATQLTGKMSELVDVAKTELSGLSGSLDQGIGVFSTEVTSVSNALQQSTNGITQVAVDSAKSVNQVATQAGEIGKQVESLIESNRDGIVSTLNNINQTTQELNTAITSLTPVIGQIEQGNLIQNLETVSTNAAEASANLRDLSKTVNDPANLILLQQTLDSARSTLQNIEKITTDLDDLTGDPQFRDSLRNLIKGLGNILASTQVLEKQVAEVQPPKGSYVALPELKLKLIEPSQPLDLVLSKPEEKLSVTKPF